MALGLSPRERPAMMVLRSGAVISRAQIATGPRGDDVDPAGPQGAHPVQEVQPPGYGHLVPLLPGICCPLGLAKGLGEGLAHVACRSGHHEALEGRHRLGGDLRHPVAGRWPVGLGGVVGQDGLEGPLVPVAAQQGRIGG